MNSSESRGSNNHLSVYLAELDIAFTQSHIRMQTITTYISVSIALAAALITAVASSSKIQGTPAFYVLSPWPFLLFGFLILREDFLMASHDRYIMRLRDSILNASNLDETHTALGFLRSTKQNKIGGLFWILLSFSRYVPSMLWVMVSLCIYLRDTWPWNPIVSLWNGVAFMVVVSLGAEVAGILVLGVEHKAIVREYLMRVEK